MKKTIKLLAMFLLSVSMLFAFACGDASESSSADTGSSESSEADATLTVDFPEMALKVGEEKQIQGVHAEGLAGQMETYTSSDPTVAEIDVMTLKVRGKKAGTATITVTYGELTKTITVTVTE